MAGYDPMALAEYRFRKLGGSRAAFAKARSNATLIQMDIVGCEALEQALLDLGNSQTIRRTLKRAVLQALEPVAKAARERAPRAAHAIRTRSGKVVDPGTYAESIDVSAKLSRRQARGRTGYTGPDTAEAFVGPKPSGPGVLEEFGTSMRRWRSGKSTGTAPAHPHMRPAWEQHKLEVLVLLGKLLWVEIQATARRIARKQAKLLAPGGVRQ